MTTDPREAGRVSLYLTDGPHGRMPADPTDRLSFIAGMADSLDLITFVARARCPCRLPEGQHYIGCPVGDPLMIGEGTADQPKDGTDALRSHETIW